MSLTVSDLIRGNKNISKDEMTKGGSLAKKIVDYNLEILKEKGIIKRVGPDKGGYWKVL